jgi:hypothetical protein
MLAPILTAIGLLVVLPVTFILTGAAIAVVLGIALRHNGEVEHAGSELIDLNR